ncbi:hypothetical protein PGT21_010145 [Puccinia graminis f. sp. tritici]|uniref:Uncharacterized protein n=1 Tax=Puccinia graminis f. sp. tritici TaxID=56615 RepID=A0A5B0QWD7_PUCGR|nr:hypothetical protein PGT21_010145 [Puccinia graminis f. sp. tritici]
MQDHHMELEKGSNHPFLFPGAAPTTDSKEAALCRVVVNSGKMILLDKLLTCPQASQLQQSRVDDQSSAEKTTQNASSLWPADPEKSQPTRQESLQIVPPSSSAIEPQVLPTDVNPQSPTDRSASSSALQKSAPDSTTEREPEEPMEIDEQVPPSGMPADPLSQSSRSERSARTARSDKRKRSHYETDQQTNSALSDIEEEGSGRQNKRGSRRARDHLSASG